MLRTMYLINWISQRNQKWKILSSNCNKLWFMRNYYLYILGAGPGTPTVTIIDPNGDTNTARMVLTDQGKSVWKCEYIPTVVGNYKVEVLFDGIPIPKSPYDVRVAHGRLHNCMDLKTSFVLEEDFILKQRTYIWPHFPPCMGLQLGIRIFSVIKITVIHQVHIYVTCIYTAKLLM